MEIANSNYSIKDISNIDYASGTIYFADGTMAKLSDVNVEHSAREIDGRICFIPLNHQYKEYARPGELMIDHSLGKLYLKLLDGTIVEINSEYSYTRESESMSHYIQDDVPPIDKTRYHTVWHQTNSSFLDDTTRIIASYRTQRIVGKTPEGADITEWVTIMPKINSDAVIVGIVTDEKGKRSEMSLSQYIAKNEDRANEIKSDITNIENNIKERLKIVEDYKIYNMEPGQTELQCDIDISQRHMVDVIVNGIYIFPDDYTYDFTRKVLKFNKPIRSKCRVMVRGLIVRLLSVKGGYDE